MNTNFEDNKSDKHLVEDEEVNKKAKRGALQKIAPQMGPSSQESYPFAHRITQHMSDGGDVETPGDPTTWHDPKSAAMAQALGLIPTAQPTPSAPMAPAQNQWNNPDYIKQQALKAMLAQPQAPAAPQVGDTDDQGYTLMKKGNSDNYADGGNVSDNDDGDDSDGDDSDDSDNSINFNLSDQDTKALTNYLDADKQRQAKIDAVKKLVSSPMPPQQEEMTNRMMQGMATGGMKDVGKDVFTEAMPIAETGFQKLKNYLQPAAKSVAEEAIEPAALQAQKMMQPSVIATPQAIQAKKQEINNLMAQHEGAYWHPAVKKAVAELNQMMSPPNP